MALEVSGKLHKIFETNQVTERFTKREFVVEVQDGKYPQFVLFQTTGDRCGMLDRHQEGEEVRVEFNLRGREWRSPKGEIRFFNSLDVWRLEQVRHDSVPHADEPPPEAFAGDLADDDIPF